jgi:hypothetical protein
MEPEKKCSPQNRLVFLDVGSRYQSRVYITRSEYLSNVFLTLLLHTLFRCLLRDSRLGSLRLYRNILPIFMTMEEAALDSKVPLNNHVEKISIDSNFSMVEEKKLLRRMDVRLVVTCGVLLCVSLMDRTNLSQGAIAG